MKFYGGVWGGNRNKWLEFWYHLKQNTRQFVKGQIVTATLVITSDIVIGHIVSNNVSTCLEYDDCMWTFGGKEHHWMAIWMNMETF